MFIIKSPHLTQFSFLVLQPIHTVYFFNSTCLIVFICRLELHKFSPHACRSHFNANSSVCCCTLIDYIYVRKGKFRQTCLNCPALPNPRKWECGWDFSWASFWRFMTSITTVSTQKSSDNSLSTTRKGLPRNVTQGSSFLKVP